MSRRPERARSFEAASERGPVSQTRYLDPEIEAMPRADLDALQEQRLLELVPYVYERSALIRSTWDAARVHPRDIASLADFRERVPFIDKDAIRHFRDEHNDPFGGLCCVPRRDVPTVWSTGGTTGEPSFLPDRLVSGATPMGLTMARNFWEFGVRPGDYLFAPGMTSRGNAYQQGFQRCGAIPLYVDSTLGDWRELFELIRRYRVGFLIINLPVILAWEHLSAEQDMKDALSSVRCVAYAGEPLGPRMRSLLEQWGVQVVLHAGSGDVASSYSCLDGDGLHLWEDIGLYECLQPDGLDPVADGEVGELVSTGIDDPVAPLVRYRTDDLVRIRHQPCLCGRTHARQWPLGRKGDQVVVDGRSILPIDIWPAIERVPETAAGLFQLVRTAREMDHLRLRVGYDPDRAGHVPEVAERVAAAVFEAVGVEPLLDMVPEAQLLALGPAHKIPRVTTR